MDIKKKHGEIKGGESFKVIDPNYVDCGRVGKVGNQFDTHLTLHFENGDYFCYSYEGIERVES